MHLSVDEGDGGAGELERCQRAAVGCPHEGIVHLGEMFEILRAGLVSAWGMNDISQSGSPMMRMRL